MVRYLKRLKFSRLGRVQAFPMYGGLGMSAPSLHDTINTVMHMYIVAVHDLCVCMSLCIQYIPAMAVVVHKASACWPLLPVGTERES